MMCLHRMQVGDKLLAVNGLATRELTAEQVVMLLNKTDMGHKLDIARGDTMPFVAMLPAQVRTQKSLTITKEIHTLKRALYTPKRALYTLKRALHILKRDLHTLTTH